MSSELNPRVSLSRLVDSSNTGLGGIHTLLGAKPQFERVTLWGLGIAQGFVAGKWFGFLAAFLMHGDGGVQPFST